MPVLRRCASRTYPARMQLCAACSRHVFHDAPACPFCGASLRASPAPASALIGLALGVALTGCGSKPGDSGDGSSSTTGTSTTDSVSGSSTGAPTTGQPTTGGPTTGNTESTSTSTSTGTDTDTTHGDITTESPSSTGSTGDDTSTGDTTGFDTTSTTGTTTGETTNDSWDTIALPYAGAVPDDGDMPL
jgi:hypothetical protein